MPNFFIWQNNGPTASIGQHSTSKCFIEEEETSVLGQNKNKSMIIHKILGWPQATKLIMTNKNYNNQQGQKQARLMQSNNLLKVLTDNVQSLSPNIDDLIALIQLEKFDVIVLNVTWLDT